MRLQQRIGCYSVTAKIGEGGMGEVYQARDTKLDRDAASDPDRSKFGDPGVPRRRAQQPKGGREQAMLHGR